MADDTPGTASPQVIGRMLYLVNVEREDAGVPPLKAADALNQAAQAHSDEMARRGFLALAPPDGTSPRAEERAAGAGYQGPVSAHVCSGPTSIAAVAAWMRGGSRAALLDREAQHLGVGMMESKWTLLLGGSRATAGAGAPDLVAPADPADPSLEVDASGETMAMNITGPTESINAVPTGPLDSVAAAAAASAPPPAPSPQSGPELSQRILDLVNGERAFEGLAPLQLSGALEQAAQAHSLDMARRDYLGHIDLEGVGVDGRAARHGYPGACGACIALGYPRAESVVRHWMQEAPSKASLMNPTYQDLGVGVSDFRWTLLLGMPPAAIAPAADPSLTGAPWSAVKSAFDSVWNRPPAPPPGVDLELAGKMLTLVNTERSRQALHPLSLSEPLCQVAQDHSNDMAQRAYFAYAAPDGQGIESRLRGSGYRGRTGANLAMGQGSPEGAVKFFLGNAGNKQNLLYADYRHLGVGCAKQRWTLVFGIPEEAPEAPVSASGDVLQRTLQLINQQRALAGLAALSLVDSLTRAAQTHADDMARRSYVGSVSPEGEDVGKRVSRAGYRWRNVTESTAGDRPTPEAVVEAWMKSPDHRANLLDADFCHAGIGVAQSRWAVVLARPQ